MLVAFALELLVAAADLVEILFEALILVTFVCRGDTEILREFDFIVDGGDLVVWWESPGRPRDRSLGREKRLGIVICYNCYFNADYDQDVILIRCAVVNSCRRDGVDGN